nr:MAG TPA: nicotinamide mononucleotide transporter PnuC [Caudoviricetes sp.]
MGRRVILMQYFKWLREEIKSINTAGGVMLAFMLGVQLAFLLTGELNTMALVTFAATMVGSACTVYMMIGKPINGLLGLVSAIGFIYINWSVGHYASVLDQLVFVLLIDLPLLIKWRTWEHRVEGGVKFLSRRGWLLTIAGMLVVWAVATYAYTQLGDTNPLWDSLSLTIGAIASIYVFKGYGDSYTLWLLSDFANIALWATALAANYSSSALPMLLTMSFYLATALYGRFVSVWSKRKI